MSLVDAEDLNTSPLVYTVADILPENGAGFFWGPSGSGKTFTILDAALAIGNRIPWLGHDTLGGTVAYAAGEGGGGLGIRIKARVLRQEQDNTAAIAAVQRDQGDAAARSFAGSLPPYTSRNLKVTTKPFPMHFLRNGVANPDLAQAMTELGRLNTPGPDDDPASWPYLRLVILDALENFSGQLSVSNRSSANRIVATMQWMAAELQCCVLAVAHPVESSHGTKMVGSDRLFAAADFVIRYAPDDVSAPGALRTATISCEKSKDDTEFGSFGVELHPCEWDEPKLDENWEPIPFLGEDGQPAVNPETGGAWATDKVTSQTVQLIEQDTRTAPKPVTRPAMPAPELRDNRPASRVRPMIRPKPVSRGGLHLVQDEPAPARPAPPLITGILSVPCPDDGCQALGGGMSCNPSVPGSGLVPLSLDPVAAAHSNRILDAAQAGRIDLDAAMAWLDGLQRKPAPAPGPAPEPEPEPEPGPAGRDPLWWTTVRPDTKPAEA